MATASLYRGCFAPVHGAQGSRDDLDVLAKLDHCVIHVSDWERSNVFYREVLGAELVDRGAGTWAYRFGPSRSTPTVRG